MYCRRYLMVFNASPRILMHGRRRMIPKFGCLSCIDIVTRYSTRSSIATPWRSCTYDTHRVAPGRAMTSGKWKSPSPPRHDRSSALLVVAVDLHALPHRVEVIGVAAHESVGGGAVLGVDDKHRPARRLAVIGNERARGHHVHVVIAGLVEMD